MAKTFNIDQWVVGEEITALKLNETGNFGTHPDFRELESNVIDLLMQAYFDGKAFAYQGLFFDGFSNDLKQDGSFRINFETGTKRITMANPDDPFQFDTANINMANKTANDTAAVTFSHTVQNKTNRLLIVTTNSRDSSVASVTFNGIALTHLSTNTAGTNGSLWYLLNPPVGTFNVIATPGGSSRMRVVANNFYGVDQTTPFGPVAQGSGGNGASTTVTTVAGDIVYSQFTTREYGGTLTNVGSGQVIHFETGGIYAGIALTTETASGISDLQSFSIYTDGYPTGIMSVAVKPASNLYDGLTGAFYKSVKTTFQQAKKTAQLWVTRNITVRFNPAASIANGATTMKLLGGSLLASGDTIDIYEANNFVRERKIISAYTQLLVDVLLVGGGGGGGRNPDDVNSSGGGGGGKAVYQTGIALSGGASIPVTVGAGGIAGVNEDGGIGGTSSLMNLSAVGGGGGQQGGTGGTSGSGNAGGSGGSGKGGGGGGDGQVGGSASGSVAGAGGNGTQNSITGTATYYGGGGGGGAFAAGGNSPGAGGLGGGASGVPGNQGFGNNGTNGLGGGGGGSGATSPAGSGGSGAVIIRYLTSQMTATGGTITIDGSYTIHTFTSSGTFTITSMSANLTFSPAISNASGFATSAFVERVDVLPQVSLVNFGDADNFQNMTHIRSIASTAAPKQFTASGSAQIDTAQNKFGGAALLLAGGGVSEFISTPDHEDFNFGNGNFTIDLWVRWNSTVGNTSFVSQWGASGFRAWNFGWDGANIVFYHTIDGTTNIIATSAAFTPSLNTWYHFAVSRSGANLKIFISGTQSGSTYNIGSNTIFNSSETVNIGGRSAVFSSVNGWMDEIRISNVARYVSNFTPESSAYTPDSNTILLVHTDGTDGSTTFADDPRPGFIEVEDEYNLVNSTPEEDFRVKLNLSRRDTSLTVYAKRLGCALQES